MKSPSAVSPIDVDGKRRSNMMPPLAVHRPGTPTSQPTPKRTATGRRPPPESVSLAKDIHRALSIDVGNLSYSQRDSTSGECNTDDMQSKDGTTPRDSNTAASMGKSRFSTYDDGSEFGDNIDLNSTLGSHFVSEKSHRQHGGGQGTMGSNVLVICRMRPLTKSSSFYSTSSATSGASALDRSGKSTISTLFISKEDEEDGSQDDEEDQSEANSTTEESKSVYKIKGNQLDCYDEFGYVRGSFEFTKIFNEKASQKKMFANPEIRDILESLFLGYNGTIFTYGQTNAGKTYTMEGKSVRGKKNKGLIPRSISFIFETMNTINQQLKNRERGPSPYYLDETIDSIPPKTDCTFDSYNHAAQCNNFRSIGNLSERSHHQGQNNNNINNNNDNNNNCPTNGYQEDLDQYIEFTVSVSYYEIYCERIRDILNPLQDNMKLRETKSDGFVVQDLTEIICKNEEEMMQVLETGKHNRATAATLMNANSSRSHSIFCISIRQKVHIENKNDKKNGYSDSDSPRSHITDNASHANTLVRKSRLFLVDLAGSEKVSQTGAEGTRLEEAKNINSSLVTLGMVIKALSDGLAHVPFRDSRLTRLLMDSLGGSSKTLLIICCASDMRHCSETMSTLRFGERARKVTNHTRINEVEQHLSINEMKKLLVMAKSEINQLKMENALLRRTVLTPLPLTSRCGSERSFSLINGGEKAGSWRDKEIENEDREKEKEGEENRGGSSDKDNTSGKSSRENSIRLFPATVGSAENVCASVTGSGGRGVWSNSKLKLDSVRNSSGSNGNSRRASTSNSNSARGSVRLSGGGSGGGSGSKEEDRVAGSRASWSNSAGRHTATIDGINLESVIVLSLIEKENGRDFSLDSSECPTNISASNEDALRLEILHLRLENLTLRTGNAEFLIAEDEARNHGDLETKNKLNDVDKLDKNVLIGERDFTNGSGTDFLRPEIPENAKPIQDGGSYIDSVDDMLNILHDEKKRQDMVRLNEGASMDTCDNTKNGIAKYDENENVNVNVNKTPNISDRSDLQKQQISKLDGNNTQNVESDDESTNMNKTCQMRNSYISTISSASNGDYDNGRNIVESNHSKKNPPTHRNSNSDDNNDSNNYSMEDERESNDEIKRKRAVQEELMTQLVLLNIEKEKEIKALKAKQKLKMEEEEERKKKEKEAAAASNFFDSLYASFMFPFNMLSTPSAPPIPPVKAETIVPNNDSKEQAEHANRIFEEIYNKKGEVGETDNDPSSSSSSSSSSLPYTPSSSSSSPSPSSSSSSSSSLIFSPSSSVPPLSFYPSTHVIRPPRSPSLIPPPLRSLSLSATPDRCVLHLPSNSKEEVDLYGGYIDDPVYPAKEPGQSPRNPAIPPSSTVSDFFSPLASNMTSPSGMPDPGTDVHSTASTPRSDNTHPTHTTFHTHSTHTSRDHHPSGMSRHRRLKHVSSQSERGTKRGLRKKESDSMEEKRLKEEIDDIFGTAQSDAFLDRVSSVYHPFQNRSKDEENFDFDGVPILPRKDSMDTIGEMCGSEPIDGFEPESVDDCSQSIDTFYSDSNSLPVGYYNATLRQFCRVTPKYETSSKKSKKKELADLSRI